MRYPVPSRRVSCTLAGVERHRAAGLLVSGQGATEERLAVLPRSLHTPQMRELVTKLATWPHGLGFLHLADAESVAATLHVHPFTVVAAREALETPEGRALLIEQVRRERARLAASPVSGSSRGEGRKPPVRPIETEDELLRTARAHPLGFPFFRDGDPEAVAVVFGVHPDLVFRARRRAASEEAGTRPGTAREDPAER
jgi:hypothetical protein